MDFRLYNTINDFLSDDAVKTDDVVKFLFKKSEFQKLDDETKSKMLKKAKNLFFLDSYKTMKIVNIHNNRSSNMETQMINAVVQFSMTKFLREHLGVNTYCVITDNFKFSPYSSLFQELNSYLRTIRVAKNDIVLMVGEIPEWGVLGGDLMTYAIRDTSLFKENSCKLKPRITKKFFTSLNLSFQNKVDADWANDNDYCLACPTTDINPVFLLDESQYLEYANECNNVNRNCGNGKQLLYYVVDPVKNHDIAVKTRLEEHGKSVKNLMSFKYDKNISFQNFIYAMKNCERIWTNKFDLLCLAIVFNKPVEYEGKEFDDYRELTENLGIDWNSDGSIANHDFVMENIKKGRMLAYEHLKDAIYGTYLTCDQYHEFNNDDYIGEFKKEYFGKRNKGIIVQNSDREKRTVDDLTLVIPFFGTDETHVSATNKALGLLLKTQKYLPSEIVFIEQQKKQEDLTFQHLSSTRIQYIPIIQNNEELRNVFPKMFLANYVIDHTKNDKIVCLDSDCAFVNEDAFLKISQELDTSDFILPYVWAYRSEEFGCDQNCGINEIMNDENKGTRTYPGFAFGITRRAYNCLPPRKKLAAQIFAGNEDNILISMFHKDVLSNLHYQLAYGTFSPQDALDMKSHLKCSWCRNILMHVKHSASHIKYYLNWLLSLNDFNPDVGYDKNSIYSWKPGDIDLKIVNSIWDSLKNQKQIQTINVIRSIYEDKLVKKILTRNEIKQYEIAKTKVNIDIYGKIKSKGELKVVILNTKGDMEYVEYLQGVWNDKLETPHEIEIISPNQDSHSSLMPIFIQAVCENTSSNCLVVDEHCIPNNRFCLSNLPIGTFSKLNDSLHAAYFHGDYSFLAKGYRDESNDFLAFSRKYHNLNGFVEFQFMLNRINVESITRYVDIKSFCSNTINDNTANVSLIFPDNQYFIDRKYLQQKEEI